MRVTQTQDNITHAVFTSNSAIEFKFVATPEMFHAFTDGLYSNKPRAVSREILCNGWDAHVDAGITDTPLNIITQRIDGMWHTSIQDFGKGIASELMEPLYATLGGTDKLANEEATGGFGLGCKSPFCLVDHFEVTSCFNGIKTIYRVAKSASELNGKPGVIPIISVPTTETGVTVKLVTECRLDIDIIEIIKQGNMNALLNGSIVHPWEFRNIPGNYYWTNYIDATFYIRYGSVIYPLSDAAFSQQQEKFIKITEGRYNYRSKHSSLIIQAAPGKIAVTPSRESISLSPKVTEYITELINETLSKFEQDIKQTIIEIDNLIHDKHMMAMNPLYSISPNYIAKYPVSITTGAERGKLIYCTLMSHYRTNHDYNPAIAPKALQQYLRHRDPLRIRHRAMIKFTSFMLDNDVSICRFNWMGIKYVGDKGTRFSFKEKLPSLQWAMNPIIILSHTYFPKVEYNLGPQFNSPEFKYFFLLYKVPRSAAGLREARALFKDAKCKIVDELDERLLEPRVKAAPKPRQSKPVKPEGLMTATSLINGTVLSFDRSKSPNTTTTYVVKPTWIYHARDANDKPSFRKWTDVQSYRFVKAFGDQIAITRNKKEYDKYVELGVKQILDEDSIMYHLSKTHPLELKTAHAINVYGGDFHRYFYTCENARKLLNCNFTEQELYLMKFLNRRINGAQYYFELQYKKIINDKTLIIPAPLDKLDTNLSDKFKIIQWSYSYGSKTDDLFLKIVEEIFK